VLKQSARIYVLIDPRDGEIRYVGWTIQTLAKRLGAHRCAQGRHHRATWIRALKREAHVPIIRLLQEVRASEAPEAERYWIRFFRLAGCLLVNTTEGGEGTLGWTPTEFTRMKMRSAHLGKKFTPEHRAKLSEALRKRVYTVEMLANMSAAHRGLKASEETRKKMSQGRKRENLSAATLQKMSVASKSMSSEARARMAAALTGRKQSAETRLKRSKALKRWHANRRTITNV
jgi:NUMOD3 motif